MHMRAPPSALLTQGYPAHTRGIFPTRCSDAAAAVNLVSYLGFRGYLSPELLIDFSNSFYC